MSHIHIGYTYKMQNIQNLSKQNTANQITSGKKPEYEYNMHKVQICIVSQEVLCRRNN